MSFLEDELEEDEGDGDDFLDDVENNGSEDFLEGELKEDNAHALSTTDVSRPPAGRVVSNEELREMEWEDHWVDSTEDFEDIGIGFKTVECSCGYKICVTERNRNCTCMECGTVHIDFDFER